MLRRLLGNFLMNDCAFVMYQLHRSSNEFLHLIRSPFSQPSPTNIHTVHPRIMLPSQKNKVDLSSLNEEEKKLFQLYGKLPAKKNPLNRMQERKFFDSGDYAMSKAGKASGHVVQVGTAIPKPETIPHASAGHIPSLSSSPVKESIMASHMEGSPTRHASSSLTNV